MRPSLRVILVLLCASWSASLHAQLPFYTDDTEVTNTGTLHFESYNEYDGLQSSEYPNRRQNTTNFKLNYGFPHRLEVDFDVPYLAIGRATGQQNSFGMGDVDMGLKWKIRKSDVAAHLPALATTFYAEFPTGDVKEQLGSGLRDYWLNFIVQEPFSEKTRANLNLGFLFAGNTSTGVVGIQTTRGHVATGGLSVLHDFSPKLTLGGEVYGGVADVNGLGRNQLQGMLGGLYALRETLSVTFGVLGGKYPGSPRFGGQVGVAVDFPHFLHKLPAKRPQHD
ncbi:MAG TPA: hypothetical protein VG844_02380 [Terracidiphilus sp.]|nr:hypothetical protein [Terracidiphilus sp.]